jgi:hypothetical protein
MKMNTIYKQIIMEQSDIFILTDTKSDGITIKSQWDWQDYQIREASGLLIGHHRCRNFGVLIGVRKHLPIVQEHCDVTAKIMCRY